MNRLGFPLICACLITACHAPRITGAAPVAITHGSTAQEPVLATFEGDGLRYDYFDNWREQEGHDDFSLPEWKPVRRLVRVGDVGVTLTILRASDGATQDEVISTWKDKVPGSASVSDGKSQHYTYKMGAVDYVSGDTEYLGEDYFIEAGSTVYILSYRHLDTPPDAAKSEVGRIVQTFEATAAGTPTPSPSATPNYYPMSDGAQWTYDLLQNDVRFGRTVVNMGVVSEKDGVVSAKVTQATSFLDPHGVQQDKTVTYTCRKVADEVTSVTDDGTHRIEIKVPLEVGTSWMDAGASVTAEAEESVTVPYKTFDKALKVVTEGPDGATGTRWYVDGLGMVKTEVRAKTGDTLVLELTDHKFYFFSDYHDDHSNPIR